MEPTRSLPSGEEPEVSGIPEPAGVLDWWIRPRRAIRRALGRGRLLGPWVILMLLETGLMGLFALVLVRLGGLERARAIPGLVLVGGLFLSRLAAEVIGVLGIWAGARLLTGAVRLRRMAIAYAVAQRGPFLVAIIVYLAVTLMPLPAGRALGVVGFSSLLLVTLYSLVMTGIAIWTARPARWVMVLVVVAAGAVILPAVIPTRLLSRVAVEAFVLPSQSMRPTLRRGDHILVNRAAFGIYRPGGDYLVRYNHPRRGDLVVFKGPGDEIYVKRVIALPRETLSIRNGRMNIDGTPVEQEGGRSYSYQDLGETGRVRGVIQARLIRESIGGVSYPILRRFCSSDFHCRLLSQAEPACLPNRTCRAADLGPVKIPREHVFLIGDNRDNSLDSRSFGPVPLQRVIGLVVYRHWPLDRAGPLRR